MKSPDKFIIKNKTGADAGFRMGVPAGEELMIEVTTNRVDDENVEIDISVPAETVDKAVNKTFQRISSTQNIKGFRKGKIPRDVMRNTVGNEAIALQALQDLLPDVYEEALEKAGVVPIDEPNFDPWPTLAEGQPMNVKVKLQVLPDFEVFDYARIPVSMNRKIEIGDKDIDETIETLRKKNAEYFPLIEDRGCVESDRVTLDYMIAMIEDDGSETGMDEKTDLVILLGDEQLLPDIEKNILGMKIGDKKEFTVNYPENYQNNQLAGKKSRVAIDLKKIERQQLPEINENFLAKVGEFKDLDTLKEDIRKRLLSFKHSVNEQNVSREMVQRVIDGTHLEVPRKLVMDEIENRKGYLRNILGEQGRTLEEWLAEQGKSEEEMEEEEYHDARMTVKRRIVFNKIFVQEQMQLFPNELEIALLHYAQQNRISTAQLKKATRNRGFMIYIRDQAREQKVMRFVRSRVKFMDDPLEPEKTDAEQKVENKADNDNVQETPASD